MGPDLSDSPHVELYLMFLYEKAGYLGSTLETKPILTTSTKKGWSRSQQNRMQILWRPREYLSSPISFVPEWQRSSAQTIWVVQVFPCWTSPRRFRIHHQCIDFWVNISSIVGLLGNSIPKSTCSLHHRFLDFIAEPSDKESYDIFPL
jgi:hypothetical protein